MNESIVYKCAILQVANQDVDIMLKMACDVLSRYHIRPQVMFAPPIENIPEKLATLGVAVENYTSNLLDRMGPQLEWFMREVHDGLTEQGIKHTYGVLGGGGFFADSLKDLKRVYKTAHLYHSFAELIDERKAAKKETNINPEPTYPDSVPLRNEVWRQFDNWQTIMTAGGEAFYVYETHHMSEQEIMRLEHMLHQNDIHFTHQVVVQENPNAVMQDIGMVVTEDKLKRMIQIDAVSDERFLQLVCEVLPEGQDGIDNNGWSDIKNWRQVGTLKNENGHAWIYDLKGINLSNRDELKDFLSKNQIKYSQVMVYRSKAMKQPVIEIQEESEGIFLTTMKKQNAMAALNKMQELQNQSQR